MLLAFVGLHNELLLCVHSAAFLHMRTKKAAKTTGLRLVALQCPREKIFLCHQMRMFSPCTEIFHLEITLQWFSTKLVTTSA